MSANPQAMQAMLAQGLMQRPQSQSYGGGIAGPQMQAQSTPMDAATQMAQKVMLLRALQQQPRGAPPTQLPPQSNPIGQNQMMGSMQAQPQIPGAQQMPGGVNA